MPVGSACGGWAPLPAPAAATARDLRQRPVRGARFEAVRAGLVPPTPRAFLAAGPTSVVLVEVLSVHVTGRGEDTTVVYRIRRTRLV